MVSERMDNPAIDGIELSIIIVNWHSAVYLAKCLQTVFAHADDLRLEVIVVDNASYDGAETLIQRSYPSVRFVQSAENLGFSRANNLGARYAAGPILLFLNPDTEVAEHALQRMVCCMREHQEIAILGCRLLNSDGSLQTSCVQSFPTILSQLLESEFLRRLMPRLSLWGMRALYSKQSLVIGVDVVCGACLMIRRDIFHAIGQFSADYFMYSDEVDLCYSAVAAGHKAAYLADAEVVHHGGKSSSQERSGFSSILQRESLARFLAKSRGARYAAAYRILIGLSGLARMALVLPLAPFRRSYRGSLLKWMQLLRWSIGAEKWAAELGSTALGPAREALK